MPQITFETANNSISWTSKETAEYFFEQKTSSVQKYM